MHPPLPTPTAVDAASPRRPGDGPLDGSGARPRRSIGRRAGAVLALTLTLAAAGAACSKTDQVATDQTTTAAPATTRPAADAAAGAGTTLGTRPGTTTGTLMVTTSTSAPVSTTTAPASTTTGGPSTTATTVPGTPADAAFCAKGLGLAETLKGLDPTKDASALTQYKQAFVELNAAAPPEVQADMNQINTIIQSLTSFDKLNEQDTQKLDEAGKRVDEWALAHCGRKFG